MVGPRSHRRVRHVAARRAPHRARRRRTARGGLRRRGARHRHDHDLGARRPAGVDDPQRRDDRGDVRGARRRARASASPAPFPTASTAPPSCRWCAWPRSGSRATSTGEPAAPIAPDYGRLHLALRSATPAATARWLADVFQLEPTGDIPDQEGDPDYTWIEFRVGTGFIVLWGGGGAVGTDSPVRLRGRPRRPPEARRGRRGDDRQPDHRARLPVLHRRRLRGPPLGLRPSGPRLGR